jgi:predicted small secreted protein
MTIALKSAACVLVCAMFLASCANTVRGVSRDVKDTAAAVGDAVR